MAETAGTILQYLRELNAAAVMLRLMLAMFCGGMIGMERGRKRRAAGFRTYMLVCMGAALTMLLGQYELRMLSVEWTDIAAAVGVKTDVSRFGAQVVIGVGFLGAGTILVTGRQKVKGLTTAAGLWASACMGLAIGAGFYECVLLAFVLIILSMQLLPYVESFVVENSPNINIFVEFDSLDRLGSIISCIKAKDIQIYDVEIERGRESESRYPNAIFSIHLNKKMAHTQLLAVLSEAEGVRTVEEI